MLLPISGFLTVAGENPWRVKGRLRSQVAWVQILVTPLIGYGT